MEQNQWKMNIRKKLFELFASERKKVVELIFFMDSLDQGNGDNCAAFWQTLKSAYDAKEDEILKMYADKMYEDYLQCKNDPKLVDAMREIYAAMVNMRLEKNKKDDLTLLEVLQNTVLEDYKGASAGFGVGVLQIWDVLPMETKMQAVSVVEELARQSSALVNVKNSVSLLNKYGGKLVGVGLAAVFLSFEIWKNMRLWWNGEISGKMCARNCIDSLVEIGGGIGGAYAGSAVGTAVFPVVGTVIGGILGGLVGGFAAGALIKEITCEIFDLPKTAAEEKAYKFLGVHRKASNDEVNTAFRKLCLKYHPDKGGSKEDFHALQMHMGIIKLARGEH